MNFLKYIANRIGISFFVLIGLSLFVFTLARVMPGDPARMALGPRAPESVVEDYRKILHLDKPFHIQYYIWVKNALSGNLGVSTFSKRDVIEDIKQYFPATFELMIFAGIIMSVFGILLGIASAMRANKATDYIIRLFSYLGICTPAFVWAILFLLVFSYILKILPTSGRLSPSITTPHTITGLIIIDSIIAGKPAVMWDALKHLIIPGVSLALGPMAQLARITRSSMADNLQRDFILLERSQAIPERIIMSKYLLKLSLIPPISVLALDGSPISTLATTKSCC